MHVFFLGFRDNPVRRYYLKQDDNSILCSKCGKLSIGHESRSWAHERSECARLLEWAIDTRTNCTYYFLLRVIRLLGGWDGGGPGSVGSRGDARWDPEAKPRWGLGAKSRWGPGAKPQSRHR
jgi:hypothetical protein